MALHTTVCSIMSWPRPFRGVPRGGALQVSVFVWAEMREKVCVWHQNQRVYCSKFTVALALADSWRIRQNNKDLCSLANRLFGAFHLNFVTSLHSSSSDLLRLAVASHDKEAPPTSLHGKTLCTVRADTNHLCWQIPYACYCQLLSCIMHSL